MFNTLKVRVRASAPAFRAALPALRGWAGARLRERSTYVGLATAVSAFGYSALGDRLTGLAEILPMLAGGIGAGLAAASTSKKPALVDGD